MFLIRALRLALVWIGSELYLEYNPVRKGYFSIEVKMRLTLDSQQMPKKWKMWIKNLNKMRLIHFRQRFHNRGKIPGEFFIELNRHKKLFNLTAKQFWSKFSWTKSRKAWQLLTLNSNTKFWSCGDFFQFKTFIGYDLMLKVGSHGGSFTSNAEKQKGLRVLGDKLLL